VWWVCTDETGRIRLLGSAHGIQAQLVNLISQEGPDIVQPERSIVEGT
jgi:hypothetical protein